ncbi:hypothetical protein HQ447_12865 [bacterium]|nr:hypothetical protein [bacterium]
MPGTGLPKGTRSRRRRKPGEGQQSRSGSRNRNRRLSLVIWTILLAVVATLSMAFSFWMWVLPKLQSETPGTVAGGTADPLPVVRIEAKFPSPSEPEALAVVKRALAVREPENVSGLFHPGGSNPEQIVNFLKGMDAMDGKIKGFEWLSSVDSGHQPTEGVLVNFVSDAGPGSRLALLVADAGGQWKVDFEAFARVVTPPWSELLAPGGPETARVRVNLARDSYYNGPFQDEAQWACFGMASPDMETILMGYCRRGSPQAAAMKSMFTQRVRVSRATLELRRVAGADKRQFEITRVLAKDWVMGDKAFEDEFK